MIRTLDNLRKVLFFVVVLTASFPLTSWADETETLPEVSRELDSEKPTSKRDEGDYVIEKRGDTTVKYKKKATYDFEGATIEGIHNKPSGSYISNIKDVKGRSIIRIRENFDAEVTDSARLVQ